MTGVGVLNWCGVLALGHSNRPAEEDLRHMVQAAGNDDPQVLFQGPVGLACARVDGVPSTQPLQVSGGGSTSQLPSLIVMDGNAYNHREIRSALSAMGVPFETDLAAETLCQAYLRFGAAHFTKPFRGEFSFALWDAGKNRLLLGRDRLGQKPLYFVQTSRWLIFATALRSVMAHPAVHLELNQELVPHFLAYGYPPAPATLFKGVRLVMPGTILTVTPADFPDSHFYEDAYWYPPFSQQGADSRSEQNLAGDLLAHLRGAVRLRLGDSPGQTGVHVTGRFDSTAMVALLAEQSSRTLRTIFVGTGDANEFSMRRYARQVSARYVTEHVEVVLDDPLPDLLQRALVAIEQPFGDPATLLTLAGLWQAGEGLRVYFGGDGGNELFAGNAHFRLARWAKNYGRLPDVAQRAIQGMLGRLPETLAAAGLMQQANAVVQAADQPLSERYLSWVRLLSGPWLAALMGGQREQTVARHFSDLLAIDEQVGDRDVIGMLLDLNLRTELPGNVLMRFDRAGRSSGVETRLPFIDHQILHFVSSIPSEYKMRRGTANYILQKAVQPLVPASLSDRAEGGVHLPLDDWFRGPYSSFATDTLLSDKARQRGLFDMEAVSALLDAHSNHEADLGYAIFTLLTFELWMLHYFG